MGTCRYQAIEPARTEMMRVAYRARGKQMVQKLESVIEWENYLQEVDGREMIVTKQKASSPVSGVCAKLLQSCLTFCDPVDHSPPDSSVREILQARILEWVAMPSLRGSS